MNFKLKISLSYEVALLKFSKFLSNKGAIHSAKPPVPAYQLWNTCNPGLDGPEQNIPKFQKRPKDYDEISRYQQQSIKASSSECGAL